MYTSDIEALEVLFDEYIDVYTWKFAVTGVDVKNINLCIEDGILKLSHPGSEFVEPLELELPMLMFPYGDEDKVTANLDNGVLTVLIGKTITNKQKVNTIPISNGKGV
jgi:HSP20 family molecular chaperone IbpA